MDKINWYSPENKDGMTVEEVIKAAIKRLSLYNSEVPSRYNAIAIMNLNSALAELDARTADRITRGVEGTTEEHVNG